MEIKKEIIEGIIRHSTCLWTKGYLAALVDAERPSRKQVAKIIIDAQGPNNKIAAIKLLRGEFGLGLKEAKAILDEYYISGRIIFPDDQPPGVAV
jgi:ribosomal protein L7/L12